MNEQEKAQIEHDASEAPHEKIAFDAYEDTGIGAALIGREVALLHGIGKKAFDAEQYEAAASAIAAAGSLKLQAVRLLTGLGAAVAKKRGTDANG